MTEGWPRFFYINDSLEWLLAVEPAGTGYLFRVARDGWILLEANIEVDFGQSYEECLALVLRDLCSEEFHKQFHVLARQYAPESPPYEDCVGDCPWVCPRTRLWEICFDQWSWKVSKAVRDGGCAMFLRDEGLLSRAALA